MSNAAFNAWIDYRDSHPDEEHPDYEILDEVADWCGRRVEELEKENATLRTALDSAEEARVANLMEVYRLREEVRLLSESTYCAYCGAKFPLDNAAAEQVAAHIRTCPKHPMRVPESEVARLRGLLGECSGWMADACDVVGMSSIRRNSAHTLLRRLAAALEKEKDHV